MKTATQPSSQYLVAVAAAMLLASSQVDATTAFNTGVNAGGVPLTVGSADPHWTVVSGPGVAAPFPAVVSSTIPAFVVTTGSAWIWTNAAGASGRNSPYTFRSTFTLSSAQASNSILSGAWAADNFGNIRLNGAVPIGTGTFALTGSLVQNFNQLYPFSINSGFVEGINSLEFTITDTGGAAGLNVSRLAIAPISEVSTLAMFAVGLAGLLGRSRRRFPVGSA